MHTPPDSFHLPGGQFSGLDHIERDHGPKQAQEMAVGKRFGSGRLVPARSEDAQGFQGFEDPLMEPESLSVFGINGIEFRYGQLFFTNSDRNILARMLIEDDGTSRASAKVYGNFNSTDGFDFNRNGKVAIA